MAVFVYVYVCLCECVCLNVCVRACVLETWRLAYSVCSAYYERENRKIRDLNYLERSVRKKGEGGPEKHRVKGGGGGGVWRKSENAGMLSRLKPPGR